MQKNSLYPIFIKPENVRFLLVGGGNVAEEKLRFLLKSSPNATVKVIAKSFKKIFLDLPKTDQVECLKKPFSPVDLEGINLLIAATENKETNLAIRQAAKEKNILVNVADTPDLCDFYLGGIVTKGNIKIAISTNGKSPTLAKRLRQLLEDILPEDIDELSENMNEYRQSLKGTFEEKVEALNQLTKDFINKS